jgi:hypothetical protein
MRVAADPLATRRAKQHDVDNVLPRAITDLKKQPPDRLVAMQDDQGDGILELRGMTLRLRAVLLVEQCLEYLGSRSVHLCGAANSDIDLADVGTTDGRHDRDHRRD